MTGMIRKILDSEAYFGLEIGDPEPGIRSVWYVMSNLGTPVLAMLSFQRTNSSLPTANFFVLTPKCLFNLSGRGKLRNEEKTTATKKPKATDQIGGLYLVALLLGQNAYFIASILVGLWIFTLDACGLHCQQFDNQ